MNKNYIIYILIIILFISILTLVIKPKIPNKKNYIIILSSTIIILIITLFLGQKTQSNINTLPVVILNTNGWDPVVLHDKQPVSFSITDSNLSNIKYDDITMWVRGQSSSLFAKKQWSIKFKKKTSLLGMAKSKKYILQGPWIDKSLIRNKFMFNLSREMGIWSPHSKFCEVLLNKTKDTTPNPDRDYWGIYLITESIDVDPNKVDIGKNDYLFSFDKIGPDDTYFTTEKVNYAELGGGQDFVLSEPDDKSDIEGLRNIIMKFQNSLYSHEFEYTTPLLANMESFVNYFILTELSMDVDAYRWSTNFYTKNGILYAGPLWDFNGALGQDNFNIEGWLYLKQFKPEGYFYKGLDGVYRIIRAGAASWIARLLKSRSFVTAIKQRIDYLSNAILSAQNLYDLFKDYSDTVNSRYYIKGSTTLSRSPVARNFDKWDVLPLEKFKLSELYSINALTPPPKCYTGTQNFLNCYGKGTPNSFNTKLSDLSALGRVYIFILQRLNWMAVNITKFQPTHA